MLLKTHYKNKNFGADDGGFTMFEIIVSSTIFLLLVAFVFISYMPVEKQKRARDEKRISDISKIDRALSEYLLDHKSFPDQINFTRKSNVLPLGGTQLNSPVSGWIFGNLSSYISVLPTDPINDDTYYYSYRHNETSFELNAVLEVLSTEMLNDGGDDLNVYEVGNNLTLITP